MSAKRRWMSDLPRAERVLAATLPMLERDPAQYVREPAQLELYLRTLEDLLWVREHQAGVYRAGPRLSRDELRRRFAAGGEGAAS